MRRTLFVFALAIAVAWPVAAQERTGAGRIEISAIPGGGVFFGSSASETEPDFGNYAVGAAFTWNVNRWMGIEGEVGSAVGLKQTVAFADETFVSQQTPCFLTYSANAVFSPSGNDHPFAPYVTAGLGGLRMIDTDEVVNLGITRPANYLAGNAGGGMKWYATRHWGARADYRLIVVNDTTNAPAFFGRDGLRYGHRIYGGVLFTY